MINKCVDALVGLQAGSEGKGKLVGSLSKDYKYLVRTGGTNSAHTTYCNGRKYLFHQLPCGSVNFPKAKLVLGANTHIDLEYLQKEIQILRDGGCWLVDGKPRLYIDKNASLVDPVDKIAENGGFMPKCGEMYFHPRDCEKHAQLGGTCIGCDNISKDSAWVKLGSTTHGCGANAIRRILRGSKMALMSGKQFDLKSYLFKKAAEIGRVNPTMYDIITAFEKVTDWSEWVDNEPIRFAPEDEFVKQFVCDTVDLLNTAIDNNEEVLLEGTQGSLLSSYHGYMGKTTSRDTNVSTWCAEAGISPVCVRDVYGVARVYPIRVAGNSGDLSGEEITWEQVTVEAESPVLIVELTSATRRKRRVFRFGDADFRKSVQINRPTKLMLTFVDQHHYSNRGKNNWCELAEGSRKWIEDVEKRHGVFFNYISTGPDQGDTIVREK